MSGPSDEGVTVIQPGENVTNGDEATRIQWIRERLSAVSHRIHEWRRSQWRRRQRNGELIWKNLCGGYVHVVETNYGWQCWVNEGDTDYGAGAYCHQHATFDMALATAFLWLEWRITPQTSMDGHPFVPVYDNEPVGAVFIDQTDALYLDDHSDVETLLEMIDKRAKLETLREALEAESDD